MGVTRTNPQPCTRRYKMILRKEKVLVNCRNRMRAICICDFCGKEFTQKPKLAERQKHQLCGYDCRNKWKSDFFTGSKNPMYGKHGEDNSLFGRKRSAETLLKISMLPRRGGRCLDSHGYYLVKKYDHPNRNCQDYVFEHRLVMEKSIGRYLEPAEVIHHIDGDITNNTIENLMLFANRGEHRKFHGELGELVSAR